MPGDFNSKADRENRMILGAERYQCAHILSILYRCAGKIFQDNTETRTYVTYDMPYFDVDINSKGDKHLCE